MAGAPANRGPRPRPAAGRAAAAPAAPLTTAPAVVAVARAHCCGGARVPRCVCDRPERRDDATGADAGARGARQAEDRLLHRLDRGRAGGQPAAAGALAGRPLAGGDLVAGGVAAAADHGAGHPGAHADAAEPQLRRDEERVPPAGDGAQPRGAAPVRARGALPGGRARRGAQPGAARGLPGSACVDGRAHAAEGQLPAVPVAAVEARPDLPAPVSGRTGHPGIPAATLQKTKEDTDRVQSVAAAETGARLREEPLRGGGGKEAIGTIIIINRNSGESVVPEPADETQAHATGGGGEVEPGGQQVRRRPAEQLPGEQVEAGERRRLRRVHRHGNGRGVQRRRKRDVGAAPWGRCRVNSFDANVNRDPRDARRWITLVRGPVRQRLHSGDTRCGGLSDVSN